MLEVGAVLVFHQLDSPAVCALYVHHDSGSSATQVHDIEKILFLNSATCAGRLDGKKMK